MSAFVVETAFTASKDSVTASLKAQAAAATTFGQRAKLAFKAATKESSVFKSVLGANLMGRAITSATGAMTRGLRSVVEEFISFDDAIFQAAAKMPGNLQPGTDAFKQLETAAREIGKQTKFSATEAAEGLNFLAMAGFNAEQSMAALPGVTDLAIVSNMDLARATDISSDALGAFNLMSADSATLTQNLARINDVFAKTVTTANVDMEMLFETMKDGGPAMTSAGQSIETFAALTGKMGQAGIKGSKAGMTIKNMMLQLSGPTSGASNALKKLGIEVADTDGNMRDIIEILGDYKDATSSMGSVQRDATTDLIFGRRAISGVNILLQEGEESLKLYRDELENASGAASGMAENIEKSLGNKLLSLKSAAIELGFQLLESFKGDGKEGLDALIETLRNFDMKPVIEGVRTVLSAMGWLFRLIRDNAGTMKILIGAFVAYKVALAGIGFAKAIQSFRALTLAAKTASAAGGAPGVTGAGAAGKAGKLGGAASAAGGVLAAATAGYAVGNIIEENLLDPLRKETETFETDLANLVFKLTDLGGGGFGGDFEKQDPEKLAGYMKQIEMTMKNAPGAIGSLEGFFSQVGSDLNVVGAGIAETFGIISADQKQQIIDMNQGPVEEQKRQFDVLRVLYAQMADSIYAAKLRIDAAAKSASTEINVNVANAPPGTTVEAKGGDAPKVNQNKAGKN